MIDDWGWFVFVDVDSHYSTNMAISSTSIGVWHLHNWLEICLWADWQVIQIACSWMKTQNLLFLVFQHLFMGGFTQVSIRMSTLRCYGCVN